MNSDKAADVRDSINSLPCVAHDAEPSQNYPGSDALTVTHGGEEWTHTGECTKLEEFTFRPAAINQAGEIGFDGGELRPCYEVVLEPLTVPFRPRPTISIPPSVVHEIAKHDCRIRVTSGLRGDHTPGTIRIRDDLAHDRTADADGIGVRTVAVRGSSSTTACRSASGVARDSRTNRRPERRRWRITRERH